MDDRDLIRVVAEDLRFLREDWDHEINDASLRRSSPVLRRLLVEGDLGTAWRALGLSREPVIEAACLDKLLGHTGRAGVLFFQAGGARYGGMEVRGAAQYGRALSVEESHAVYERTKDNQVRSFSLSRFRESPSMIVRGETILRREVVLYVCNKCGGSHFDAARDDGKELERKFKHLDLYQGDFQIAGKNPVYFELLSVGQAIAESADVGLFLQWSRYAIV